ncbi:MAG TPA: hypothetical protein VN644_16375 [Pyrinomonadaceae bacterium]|jgi:hypothetical protein|nr:hypothetical protein [Pyrinomonadaceae bacterium]
MKNILLVVLIAFALSLCNLSGRFKKGSGSNSGPTGSGSSRSVETAKPTAEQTAALAGGTEVKWDRQGMSWTIPPNWTEETNESKMFVMRSPGGGDAASMIVNISPMDADFPADSSIQAFFDQAESRAKNGEVDEVKWVEIDGLKGVQFREANPERPDDSRRLQWLAYRKYTGQLQMINLMLASQGKDFERHKNAMYGILYSTKVTH